MAPTCQSLTLSSPCAAQCAVWRPTPPEAPNRHELSVGEPSPFSRPATSPSRPRPSPRTRHLPSLSFTLPFLSFSSLRSPWTQSERAHCLSSRFASSAPRIPNPLHPKLLHLSSVLPNLSIPSHDPCFAGNRRFPGRQPLKPLGALVAVELPPPAVVFFVQ